MSNWVTYLWLNAPILGEPTMPDSFKFKLVLPNFYFFSKFPLSKDWNPVDYLIVEADNHRGRGKILQKPDKDW